jgi:hypothetical protein
MPALALRSPWAPGRSGDALPRAALPPLPVRMALVFCLLSITVFSRFGLRVGGHPVDTSLIALYLLLATLLWHGWTRIDPRCFLLYGTGACVATLSLLVNGGFDTGAPSASSLALLFTIYLPFVFAIRLPGDAKAAWQWTLGMFSHVALLCALAGIAQFYAQFFIHEPWLFNFTGYVPWHLQGPTGYNTVIPVGELYKSNGFFLREPSHFSFLMALALVAELQFARRPLRLAAFGMALLLTYSGTGLLALSLGLMFPLGRRTLVQLLVLSVVGFVMFGLLGDTLNLNLTLNRVNEFGSERSSAYTRYIAPMRLLTEEIASTPWAVLLGHGPGTMQRVVHGVRSFDPTWAKLLFEYGLLGFGAFVALVGHTMSRFAAPVPLRVMLFMCWLVMGGYLLSPENCTMLYVLLCGWSEASADGPLGASRGAST